MRRHKGGDEDEHWEMVRTSTGARLLLTEEEGRLVRQFDGRMTVAEMVVAELAAHHKFSVQPLLRLADRLHEQDMLAAWPPDFYRQLDRHLAHRSVELARQHAQGGAMARDALSEAVDVVHEVVQGGHDAPHPAGTEPAVAPSAEAGDIGMPDGAAPAAVADESADADADAEGGPVSSFEQVPWRPISRMLAERAEFLRTVPLFAELDSWVVGALAEAAHEEAYPAFSNVVEIGQDSDRFFIVQSGEISVLNPDDDGKMKRVARLGPADYFGETGLLDLTTRNATVRVGAMRPAVLLSFERTTFERIIAPHIGAFRGRQVQARRRSTLEGLPLFSALGSDELDRVAHVVKEHRVPEGTTVVRQGDPGDRFYIVVSGQLEVLRDGRHVAELDAGQFFGETALLFTATRTATVEAASDCVLWSIDGEAFEELLRGHLLGRRDMMPTVMNRLHG